MPKNPNLGAPHPTIPHLYYTLPTTAAGQVYPYLKSSMKPTPTAQSKEGLLSDAARSHVSPLGGTAMGKK
jgi:hypothetical protein